MKIRVVDDSGSSSGGGSSISSSSGSSGIAILAPRDGMLLFSHILVTTCQTVCLFSTFGSAV
jgi:hypothetical protein